MSKLSILFTIAITAIATITYGQKTEETATKQTGQDTRTRLYIGLKGGFSIANVYDAKGENFEADAKSGFAGGLFVTIPIGELFGIQPEVLFSQKGFKATGTLLGNPYTMTRTANFIDVPILMALKPGPSITLLAGPQFSYLIKQRDEFEGSPMSSVVEEEFKNDNIRKNILCFVGGLDFNFNQIVVGTRVGWDIQSNSGDGTSTTPRYKNVWIQASLGVRF
jgi:hypothetical protein